MGDRNSGIYVDTVYSNAFQLLKLSLVLVTSPPIGGGRGIVMPLSVCVFVCVFVCLSVFSQNFKV